MLVDDYLMRQIADLASAIARIADGASGAPAGDVEASLDEAYRGLTGLERDLAEAIDASSLSAMAGSAPKRLALASLVRAHAQWLASRGRPAAAATRLSRAAALLDLAERHGADGGDERAILERLQGE